MITMALDLNTRVFQRLRKGVAVDALVEEEDSGIRLLSRT